MPSVASGTTLTLIRMAEGFRRPMLTIIHMLLPTTEVVVGRMFEVFQVHYPLPQPLMKDPLKPL